MPTQAQFNATTKMYRNINIKISILDYDFYLLDEISGLVETANFSIDADSDIRRTCDITMQLYDKFNVADKSRAEYWKAGNPYWFDKYLKIEIGIKDGDDYTWSNQGIYLINEPSITYDAETNEVSFQAVDLMAKLTGMRNGILEGSEHIIPINTNIRSAITTIIAEFGFKRYIIIDPPQATTPYEINIDAGGTAYDLLSELRDINSDWEMFFDIDGVFYFQQISSNEALGTTVNPFVTSSTWDKLAISYQLDTSYEDVKNYIEVYGQTKTTNATGTATITSDSQYVYGDKVSVVADLNFSDMEVGYVYDVAFTIGDIDEEVELLDTPIAYFNIKAQNEGGAPGVVKTLDDGVYLRYNNFTYVGRLIKESATSSVTTGSYLGHYQAYGYAYEHNQDSPFYVGNLISGTIPVKPALLGGRPSNIYECDDYLHKPKFDREIRYVCSGGEYDNIYSDVLAIQRAKYELYLRARKHDSIEIKCVPIYWLDVNTIIEFQLKNEDTPTYWLVKSVSTDFGVDGTQSITATRYYPNYTSTT